MEIFVMKIPAGSRMYDHNLFHEIGRTLYFELQKRNLIRLSYQLEFRANEGDVDIIAIIEDNAPIRRAGKIA